MAYTGGELLVSASAAVCMLLAWAPAVASASPTSRALAAATTPYKATLHIGGNVVRIQAVPATTVLSLDQAALAALGSLVQHCVLGLALALLLCLVLVACLRCSITCVPAGPNGDVTIELAHVAYAAASTKQQQQQQQQQQAKAQTTKAALAGAQVLCV